MGLFRRREPLHERLAREGGLLDRPPTPDTRPQWQETGIHGIARPREWDATATVDAPDLEGDSLEFVALPGEQPPLAVPLEPPYRARAARQSGTLWAVQARRIEVIELPEGPAGDFIELTRTAAGTTLAVDDARQFGSIPALEARGEREGAEYVVRATRLRGDLWEIRAEAL